MAARAGLPDTRAVLSQCWSNISGPFEQCDFTTALMTASVCVSLQPASSLMTDTSTAPFVCVHVYMGCVCVGWELCQSWVSARLPPPIGGLHQARFQPGTLRVYLLYNVFNPGRLICRPVCTQSNLDLEPGTSSTHTYWLENGCQWNWSQATHVNLRALLCLYFPLWYLVYGMKKCVIIAKWKGKGEKEWGQRKEKVKLNIILLLSL